METPCFYCGDREDISQCRKCDEAWLCPTHEEPHCGRDPSECAPFKGESVTMKDILCHLIIRSGARWEVRKVSGCNPRYWEGQTTFTNIEIDKVPHNPPSLCKCQSIILMFAASVRQGSVILRDQASVLGPMITKTKLACLNCLATEGLRPCSRCKWPGTDDHEDKHVFYISEHVIFSL